MAAGIWETIINRLQWLKDEFIMTIYSVHVARDKEGNRYLVDPQRPCLWKIGETGDAIAYSIFSPSVESWDIDLLGIESKGNLLYICFSRNTEQRVLCIDQEGRHGDLYHSPKLLNHIKVSADISDVVLDKEGRPILYTHLTGYENSTISQLCQSKRHFRELQMKYWK